MSITKSGLYLMQKIGLQWNTHACIMEIVPPEHGLLVVAYLATKSGSRY